MELINIFYGSPPVNSYPWPIYQIKVTDLELIIIPIIYIK